MALRQLIRDAEAQILVNEELVDSYAENVYRPLIQDLTEFALSYADVVVVPLFPAVTSNILEPQDGADVNRIVVASDILTIESATGTDLLQVVNGILQVSDE